MPSQIVPPPTSVAQPAPVATPPPPVMRAPLIKTKNKPLQVSGVDPNAFKDMQKEMNAQTHGYETTHNFQDSKVA